MSDNFSDSGQGSGKKFNILFGPIIALVAAMGFSFYQVSQLRSELAETREMLGTEIAKVSEISNVSTKTGRASMDTLKQQVDAARDQASKLAGQARIDASKHADDLRGAVSAGAAGAGCQALQGNRQGRRLRHCRVERLVPGASGYQHHRNPRH